MMDVKRPFLKLISDVDNDSAINFLDSEEYDKKIQGPIGFRTKNAKLK